MTRIQQCLSVLAGLGGALLALAAAAPAALASLPLPPGNPAGGDPHRRHRRHARLADHPDRGRRRPGRRRDRGDPRPRTDRAAAHAPPGHLTHGRTGARARFTPRRPAPAPKITIQGLEYLNPPVFLITPGGTVVATPKPVPAGQRNKPQPSAYAKRRALTGIRLWSPRPAPEHWHGLLDRGIDRAV